MNTCPPLRLLRFLWLPLFLSAVAKADSPPSLRILSYNIHHGAGLDGKIDLERIARVIQSASPDIVSLQEVDRKTKRSGGLDQAARLADLTGMNLVFGSSMLYQGGQYGNAILTKLKVVESKTIPLPGEPRSALFATLEEPDQFPRLHFIATHLDVQGLPRQASLPLIEKMITTLPPHPAILAGDLNATPDSPTMTSLFEKWQNATSGPDFFTSPANQPTSQIDYILIRPAKHWKVVQKKVLPEPLASDHRPILAVLELLARRAAEEPEKTR